MSSIVKYSVNALLDTYEMIKKAVFVFDLIVQIVYVLFIGYFVIFESKNFIINLVLLIVSFFYLIYHISTTREFYTSSLKKQKDVIKKIVKVIKYFSRTILVTLAVYEIAISTGNDSLSLLVTVFMIIGLILSIIFDWLVIVIGKRVFFIKNSFFYDFEVFKNEHRKTTAILNKIGDFDNFVPPVDEKAKKQIIKVDDELAEKKRRENDFRYKKAQK